MPSPTAAFHRFDQVLPSLQTPEHRGGAHNLELQLMPPSSSIRAGRAAPGMTTAHCRSPRSPALSSQGNDAAAHLALSIGGQFLGGAAMIDRGGEVLMDTARANEEEAREQLRQAVAEKAAADEARALAEQELASAKRMRRQAQVELSRAHALREHAVRQVNATLLQITCLSCRRKFHRARPPPPAAEVVCSYVSPVVTKGGDAEVDEPLDAADGMMRRGQDTKLVDVL
jgi:hypothetical protein